MIDYNDGNWHGWNGGECPVHPESMVKAIAANGNVKSDQFTPALIERAADTIDWGKLGDAKRAPIVAFSVTKPYVEPPKPLEIWVNVYPDGSFSSIYKNKESAEFNVAFKGRTAHFREVLE